MPAVMSSATTGNLGAKCGKGGPSLQMQTMSGAAPGPSRFSRKRVVDEKLVEQSQVNRETHAQVESLTAQDFCQRLLVEGLVQSYVDFYHLTHRANPDTREQVEAGEQISVSLKDMIFIRDTLTLAERAKRAGDTLNVYLAFTRLAEHFARLSDHGTAVFFYEKCLDIATLTSDMRAEMMANHALGTVYQTAGGQDELARRYHERHNELAESVEFAEEIIKANAELFRVYTSLADAHYEAGRTNEALELYQMALTAGKRSWNKAAEAEANGKIGALLLQRGDAAASVPFLRSQSQIAADNGNAESRCRACSHLALAYDSLGKPDQALGELTLVGSISEQAGDVLLQAQACRALGTLYSKVGRLVEALDALQRYFSLLKQILAKQAKDAAAPPPTQVAAAASSSSSSSSPASVPITLKDIELARAYVGVAKGNVMMGAYVVAIQHDFNSVLGWKLNRSAVEPPAAPEPESVEDGVVQVAEPLAGAGDQTAEAVATEESEAVETKTEAPVAATEESVKAE